MNFIFVGHSSPLKGFDQLMLIIEQVAKERDFIVHWVGNATSQFIKIIKQKNLPIKVHGILQPEELNKLYSQMDAALIASACETCSYAAIEALSAELPIIATRAPGVEEILKDVAIFAQVNNEGLIDAEKYADAMKKIIDDQLLRDDMSLLSAQRYKQFTAKAMVDKMIELYEKLIWK
jgi:glycosyltransferase involved in cell wall biosynthesis